LRTTARRRAKSAGEVDRDRALAVDDPVVDLGSLCRFGTGDPWRQVNSEFDRSWIYEGDLVRKNGQLR
jgi:hypothetical protein